MAAASASQMASLVGLAGLGLFLADQSMAKKWEKMIYDLRRTIFDLVGMLAALVLPLLRADERSELPHTS